MDSRANKAGPSRPSVQGQTLITVGNDPRADANKGWWGFGRQDLHNSNWTQAPPPLDPQKYPHYTRRDLGAYLKIVQSLHQQFIHERSSLGETASRQLLLGDSGPQDEQHQAAALREATAQGDGLAKALQKVPVLFFQENFSVERSGLLSTGDDDSLDQLMERIDTLSGYLDVVETQMAREVAVRSQAVSQASLQVGVLDQQLCGALGNIRLLRSHLGEADAHTYASTCQVMALQRRRRNVDDTLEALQSLEELHSSRTALQLLLDGQDYAGALDLLEVVAHNMEASCLQGINTFAAALPQMLETRELLESLLACEFVGLANFGSAHLTLDAAVAHICSLGPGIVPNPANLGSLVGSENGLRGRDSSQMDDYMMGEEAAGAEEEAAVAREQLHDKLLPVVLALLRVDRLSGAMHQLHENVNAATKGLIAEALERCLGPTGPPYLQQPGGASASGMMQDGADGGVAFDGAQPGQGGSTTGTDVDQGMAAALRRIGHDGFMQVLFVIHAVVLAFVRHCSQLSSIIRSDILPAARVAPATTQAVTRDTVAITQGLAEVAHTRWVRLLNSRSSQTPRLRLYEFQGLSDACEAFASMLEPLSMRAAMGVRSAAQAQGKVFLDALHARNVAQLQHLLEAEQWTIAEVPPQFQAIVDRLVQRALPSTASFSGMSSSSSRHHQRNLSLAGSNDLSGVAAAAVTSVASLQRSSTMQTSSITGRGSYGASTATDKAGSSVPASGLLQLQGKAFPLVNTTLMILKLLDEYLSLADSCPMFVLEVGHHVCDLIKVFNSQAFQLVLNARAVRTAGLKSISAKHLALSCESCYMLARLLPSLRGALLSGQGALLQSGHGLGGASLEPRRRMLMLEFDKVGSDLSTHTSDIHSKLVDIMQDRLVAAARQLTLEAGKWGAPGVPFENSQALTSLHKQLTTLHTVLWPLLQQEEVQYIFGRVASLYSEALAVTFDALQHPKLVLPPTPQPVQNNPLSRGLGVRQGAGQGGGVSASVTVDPKELAAWEEARRRNALFALQCLQQLALDPAQVSTYLSRLSTFLTKHYGSTAPFQANGHSQQQPTLQSAGSGRMPPGSTVSTPGYGPTSPDWSSSAQAAPTTLPPTTPGATGPSSLPQRSSALHQDTVTLTLPVRVSSAGGSPQEKPTEEKELAWRNSDLQLQKQGGLQGMQSVAEADGVPSANGGTHASHGGGEQPLQLPTDGASAQPVLGVKAEQQAVEEIGPDGALPVPSAVQQQQQQQPEQQQQQPPQEQQQQQPEQQQQRNEQQDRAVVNATLSPASEVEEEMLNQHGSSPQPSEEIAQSADTVINGIGGAGATPQGHAAGLPASGADVIQLSIPIGADHVEDSSPFLHQAPVGTAGHAATAFTAAKLTRHESGGMLTGASPMLLSQAPSSNGEHANGTSDIDTQNMQHTAAVEAEQSADRVPNVDGWDVGDGVADGRQGHTLQGEGELTAGDELDGMAAQHGDVSDGGAMPEHGANGREEGQTEGRISDETALGGRNNKAQEAEEDDHHPLA